MIEMDTPEGLRINIDRPAKSQRNGENVLMCLFCSPADLRVAQTSRRRFMASAVTAPAAYVAARVLGPGPAAAQTNFADTIIENAKVITLDPVQPEAQAIAIRGDRILAVGPRRDLEAHRGPQTRVVDAGGRTVIPGLIDAHSHFLRGGNSYSQELRWDGVPSLADGLRVLREQAQRVGPPNWVQVIGGWTPIQFAERRFPTMEEIEAATGDVPAFVQHLYERTFINRAGRRLLNITRDTPDMPNVRIERDTGGEPTGVFFAVLGIAGLAALWGRLPQMTAEQQVTSTRMFMREHSRLGITSVIDPGGAGQQYPRDYQAISSMAAEGLLSVRISYSLFAQSMGREMEDFRAWTGRVRQGEGNEFLRMLGGGEYLTWSAVDGALAAEPLELPPVMEGQLEEVLRHILVQGWPFRMHVTHDQPASRILNVLERVHREMPLNNLRWAFDHCEGISPRSLERVAAMGGAVCIQNRMSLSGDAYHRRVGAEISGDAPPIQRIRSMGIPMPAGTDANRVISHNVWVGLHWLVTGKTASGAALLAERNRLSRTDALRAYTESAAWLSREEAVKGTLKPGMFADLAVLSDDYMTVPDDRIPQIQSVLTYLAGRVVYGDGPFAAMAPPPIRVSPDWMPGNHNPGFWRADLDSPSRFARASDAVQVMGEDGVMWTLGGCACAA
jgi:predicted amidohydrolase YtcJ